MITNRKPILCLLICLILSSFCFGQQNIEVDSLLALLHTTKSKEQKAKINLQLSKLFERMDIAKSKSYAFNAIKTDNDSIKSESFNQLGRANYYQNQLDSASYYFGSAINLLKNIDLQNQAASISISLGAVQLRIGEYKNAINTLIDAVQYFEQSSDSINMGKCYNNLSSAFGELGETDKAIDYGIKALQIFDAKNMFPFKMVTLPNLAGQYLKLGDSSKAKSYFLKAEALAIDRNDQFSLARIYNNLGNMYLESNYEVSESYLNKALQIREATKNNDGIGTLYNNLGYLQLKKEQYLLAIPLLKSAIETTQGTNKIAAFSNLSDAYIGVVDYQLALKYANMKTALNDSLLKVENNKAIAEINTKYETAKKEREILNLKNENLITDIKRKQNRNILFILLGVLVIGVVLGYAVLKNATKKRIIAEQLQELEHQKVEKLLKEQELIGLDAMIAGQEEERQRISEDLHDSLGGKLSALKLYIQDVQQGDKALYLKLKTVLDECYDDVRSISHEKSGTSLIDNGLIPAVNIVANRLKSTRQISIDVTNIDLHSKVRNNVEIQLFRIIQELLVNTMKHANAKNITIQFSEEDDNSINVIYEDDGIGFNLTESKLGLGLKNIKNRVRKIDGTFTVDSSFGNGTTVIINAPK